MTEGAHMVCSCRGGAEGPWKDGDLLYVCFTREAGAIIVMSPDGHAQPWGAHHLPTMFRDLQAGTAAIMWRDAEWCANVGKQWDSATTSHKPPMRATA